MKKILALIIAVILSLSSITTAFAESNYADYGIENDKPLNNPYYYTTRVISSKSVSFNVSAKEAARRANFDSAIWAGMDILTFPVSWASIIAGIVGVFFSSPNSTQGHYSGKKQIIHRIRIDMRNNKEHAVRTGTKIILKHNGKTLSRMV